VALSVATPASASPEICRACSIRLHHKESARGTGLGLSQVYGFAKQSGARRDREHAGHGTTVRLICGWRPRTCWRSRRPSAARRRRFRARVLIVEDHEDRLGAGARPVDRARLFGAIAVNVDGAPPAAPGALRRGADDILLPAAKTGFDLARQIRAAYPQIALLLATRIFRERRGGAARGFSGLRKPMAAMTSCRRAPQVLAGGCSAGAIGRETRLRCPEGARSIASSSSRTRRHGRRCLRALPTAARYFDPTRGDWKPGKYDLEKAHAAGR